MSENAVEKLPTETVKLLTSSQIITSVPSIVKELVENSIDAGAKIIQVRLENYGFDLVEVKDNGSGISYDNVQRMFLPGYTSKIKKFEDLDNLSSYGFRGEALAAICKVAKISITTKTCFDSLAMTYDIDATGLPVSSKPSHLANGTIINVTDLFSNLPVRRLFLTTKKKMAEELKKTEHIVQWLSLIHPDLNVSLIHNKCVVWKKNSVKGLKQSFMQVVSLKAVSKMDQISKSINEITVELIIPKKNLENVEDVFTNSTSGIFVYVNKRPVTCKCLSQPVEEHIFHHYRLLQLSYKHAIILVSITIPPQLVDINLEPNKTKVLLKNEVELIKLIDGILNDYYKNEDFHCSALKEALEEVEFFEDLEVVEEFSEEHKTKKPRLENKECKKISEKKISQDFVEKNTNWELKIIHEDVDNNFNSSLQTIVENENCQSDMHSVALSLCSQINKDNSVLATNDEVLELNAKLNEKTFQSVISTNSKNSVTRLVERNDLQSHPAEKKVLPEWPIRNSEAVANQDPIEIDTLSEISLNNSELPKVVEESTKSLKELAAEIESDAEKWSSEILKAMENEDCKKFSPSLEEEAANFDLSMQSISSQMGKKEMKAFTKFARIMRPKIAAEFPRLAFTQVAKMLAERWKALTPAEVNHYKKMSEIVELNRRIHREDKEFAKMQSEALGKKNVNLKSLFERIKSKSKLSRPPRKEVSLVASVDKIKQSAKNTSNGSSNCDYQIIGQLHPSCNWLYLKGKEIGHLRHQGLLELITYQKMLSSHDVPRKKLEKSVLITESNLGTSLWAVFVSLDTEYCSSTLKRIISSDVIVKNGFRIEVEMIEDVIFHGNITEVAATIPHFGISELKDALNLYLKNGEIGGLASWRPISVRGYITNEAIRLNQNSTNLDRLEIEDILNTYHLCFRHAPPFCLHSKPIFMPIYHIQE